MLLAECTYSTSIQSFSLVVIDCLEEHKDSNITEPKPMRGVRGETTQDYVSFERKL